MALPPPGWLIRHFLPDAGLVLMVGEPMAGKSRFALQAAMSLVGGLPTLGDWEELRIVAPVPVCYCGLEDPLRRLRRRCILMKEALKLTPDRLVGLYVIPTRSIEVLGNEGPDDIVEIVERTGAKLVVLDTLQRVKSPGQNNANAYENDVKILAGLQEVAERLKITILCIDRTSEALSGDIFQKICDSKGIRDTVYGTLGFTRSKVVPGSVRLLRKLRDAEGEVPDLILKPEGIGWRVAGCAGGRKRRNGTVDGML